MAGPARTLGAKIRGLRQQHDLSQEELSSRVGIHYTFLGHIERGSKIPSLPTLFRIAGALAISPWQLLRDVDSLD